VFYRVSTFIGGERGRNPQVRQIPAASASKQTPPRPQLCVRQFPTLSPDTALLVGFDASGAPKILVQLIRAEEDVDAWERLIMKALRRKKKRGRPSPDSGLLTKALTLLRP
jgi:hypothetical protein